jgi:predicted Zn-dependent protease
MYNAGSAYAYSNPFYGESSYAANTGLDYSQPIQVPASAPVNVTYANYVQAPTTATDSTPQYQYPQQADSTPQYGQPADSTQQYVQQLESALQYARQALTSPPPTAEAPADAVPPEATQDFDAARAAFKAQDYGTALSDIDAAIKALNSDATMHEFRALILFAQKKYKDAAAGIYAVLSVGPGWNWDTMNSLYASTDIYTQQLRDLEKYVVANTDAPDGHFLLAYHYFVIGHVPNAVAQLEKFAKLVPDDKLTPELVKAFTAAPSDKPKAEAQ